MGIRRGSSKTAFYQLAFSDRAGLGVTLICDPKSDALSIELAALQVAYSRRTGSWHRTLSSRADPRGWRRRARLRLSVSDAGRRSRLTSRDRWAGMHPDGAPGTCARKPSQGFEPQREQAASAPLPTSCTLLLALTQCERYGLFAGRQDVRQIFPQGMVGFQVLHALRRTQSNGGQQVGDPVPHQV